jgi:hypothetical protein
MAERIYDITEIAKRTRESLAKEFPNLTFSVTKKSFAGGSSLHVALMKGDFDAFTDSETKHVQLNPNYIEKDDRLTAEAKRVMERAKDISEAYNWDNSDPMTDYFDVNYYLHLNIGKWDTPYQKVASKSTSSSAPRRFPTTERKSYPMGEVLNTCAGWTIYKKTLPDGRVVYNAKINVGTSPNKTDWNAIKGEIYTETAFKWGKFGAFERWGQIASEAFVIKRLCEILGKYYDGSPLPAQTEETPAPAPEQPSMPQEEPRTWMVGDMFYINGARDEKYYIESLTSDGDVYLAKVETPEHAFLFDKAQRVTDLFNKNIWIKAGRYDYPTEENPKTKSKEDIEKAIKGLQYLADKGNEKAIKAIKGLQYLLNK